MISGKLIGPIIQNVIIMMLHIMSSIDVDECVFGLHTCNERANCINTNGSYSCVCKQGYVGNGDFCEYIGKEINNYYQQDLMKQSFTS